MSPMQTWIHCHLIDFADKCQSSHCFYCLCCTVLPWTACEGPLNRPVHLQAMEQKFVFSSWKRSISRLTYSFKATRNWYPMIKRVGLDSQQIQLGRDPSVSTQPQERSVTLCFFIDKSGKWYRKLLVKIFYWKEHGTCRSHFLPWMLQPRKCLTQYA